MSGGIRIDSGWIGDYAKTVGRGADELAQAARTVSVSPLSSTAFGQIGQMAGVTDAYHRAAQLLQGQLERASQALQSVADNLHKITSEHTVADEQQASQLKQVHQD